jgi:hypothetical protein
MVHPRLARLDRYPSSGKQIVDPLLFLGREGRKIAPEDLPEVDPVGVLKVRGICIHPRDGRGRLSWWRGRSLHDQFELCSEGRRPTLTQMPLTVAIDGTYTLRVFSQV